MKMEHIFYCEGPGCEAHVRTAAARPGSLWITVTETGGIKRHTFGFHNWDCLMKFAAQFEPPEIIPFHPEGEGE